MSVDIPVQVETRGEDALKGLARGLGEVADAEDDTANAAERLAEAQKRMLARVLGAEAGLKSQADALGISTQRLKQINRELAQTQVTADRSTSGFSRLSGAVDAAGRKTGTLGELTGKTNVKLKEAENVSGELDSVLQGLASAMDLAGDGAGNMARGLGDASGGIEALLRGVLSLPVPLKLAAAAVLAVGAAYGVMRARAKEAREEAERAAAAAKAEAEANTNVAFNVERQELRNAVNRGELDPSAVTNFEVKEEIDEQFAERRELIETEREVIEERLKAAREELAGIVGPDGEVLNSLALSTGGLERTTTTIATEEALLADADANLKALDVESDILTAATIESRTPISKGGTAPDPEPTKKSTGDTTEAEATTDAISQSLTELRTALEAAARLGDTRRTLANINPTAVAMAAAEVGTDLPTLEANLSDAIQAGDVDSINALLAAFEETAKAAKKIEAELEKSVAELEKNIDKLAADTGELEAATARMIATLDQGADQLAVSILSAAGKLVKAATPVATSLATGNLSGGLSAAGGAIREAGLNAFSTAGSTAGAAGGLGVAALGAGVGGLGALIGLGALNDDRPGVSTADALKEMLEGQKENLLEGIEALPDILLDVIPPFVVALVTELPPAIARALYEVIAGLFQRGNDLTEEQAEKVASGTFGTTSDAFATTAPDAFATSSDAFATTLRRAGGQQEADQRMLSDLFQANPTVAFEDPHQLISRALSRGGDQAVSQPRLRAQGIPLGQAMGGGGNTYVIQDSVFGSEEELARMLKRVGSEHGRNRSTS